MIPGVDEPVSPEQEIFTFIEPIEGERPSKYFFAAGTYPGKIVSLTKGMSKSGNPQYVVSLVGTGGPARGIDYKDYVGRPWEKTDPGYTENAVAPNTVWKFSKLLDAVGVPKVAPGQVRNFTKADIVGKDVGVELKQDEYNGKKSMKVDRLVPFGSIPVTNVTAGQLSNDNIPF